MVNEQAALEHAEAELADAALMVHTPPAGEQTGRPAVHGAVVDDATRCVHYNGPTDIVAIKFRCCGRFYPCFQCHADAEQHPPARWAPAEWAEHGILCGACGRTLSIDEYRAVSGCPACGSAFNDGCRLHAHLYFEVPPAAG